MEDGRRTVGRTALALTVIAVVIRGDGRLVDSRGVGDSAAKAVTGERHVDDGDSRKVLKQQRDLVGVRKYLVSRASKRYLRGTEG